MNKINKVVKIKVENKYLKISFLYNIKCHLIKIKKIK